MREYDVVNMNGETVDTVYGYSIKDAREKHPEYADSKYQLCGGWYVD